MSLGQRVVTYYPSSRYGRVENHAAVNLLGTRLKSLIGKPKAPRLEKFINQIGKISSVPKIIDAEMRMSRV